MLCSKPVNPRFRYSPVRHVFGLWPARMFTLHGDVLFCFVLMLRMHRDNLTAPFVFDFGAESISCVLIFALIFFTCFLKFFFLSLRKKKNKEDAVLF